MDSATPGSQLKASITDASLKIESIIDDAERAAADIRAEARSDAEREARRLVSESSAQLSAVVDPLVRRVESLRVEAAALMHDLEAATMKLAELTKRTTEPSYSGGLGSADNAPPIDDPQAERSEPGEMFERAEGSSGPSPVAYPGKGANSNSSSTHPPEEAVLRATQMAVAGSSRSEIEDTLRVEFGLEDAGSVVDDILGPA